MIRVCFTLWYALLVVVFCVRIFEPGTPQTLALLEALAPVMKVLTPALAILTWPVRTVCELLAGFLPPDLQAWFPLAPAGAFVHEFFNLLRAIPVLGPLMPLPFNTQFEALYPGHFDWPLLITGILSFVIEKPLSALEGFLWEQAKDGRRQWEEANGLRQTNEERYRVHVPDPTEGTATYVVRREKTMFPKLMGEDDK